MAETYKGLTIRIGGDTTKLQQSLRAADSAITNTQSQLRKMTQALKFDPSSTKAAVTSLELMADKAVEVNRRLSELRDAQRKIANQKVDFGNNMQSLKTLQQLADETDDISQRAADAKNQYNNLNAELEKLYRETNNVARASERFGKSFDIRDESDLESIRADLVSVGAATDETVDRMQQLRSMWQTAFNENEIGKALLQFRDLQSEITKTSAEAKSTSNTFLQMSRSISKLKMESSIDDELRKVSAAADSTDEHIQRMLSTLKQNPTSVESIREAMVSLDDAARLTQQRFHVERRIEAETQKILCVHDAKHVVEVAFNRGKAGMPRFDRHADPRARRFGKVDGKHLRPGNHKI